MTERPTTAYKVLRDDEMRALVADGRFAGSPADRADGFVHLSTEAQLEGTVDRHFAGEEGLHLVAVDLEALGPDLRWELSRGGALFPHLHAPLLLETVIAYGPMRRNGDGQLILPVAG